jgi:predicted P-loop ATPase
MTPQELLLANGITTLRSYAPGDYSTICPRCSHARKRVNQKLPVLSIKIDGNGACWCCHHCQWSGPEKGTGGNGEAPLKYHLYSQTLRKVRNQPGRVPKCYWQHLNGSGEWEPGSGGAKTAPMLYRFDEAREAIAAGEVIAIVEGEKDVDSLWRIGIPATCNAHGASDPSKNQKPKWTRAHSKQLAEAKIVILNDNDPAGYAHAEAIKVCSTGIVKQVRRLDLKNDWPDIGAGNDVSDWLNGGGGTAERLLELIEAAPVIAARTSIERRPWFDDLRKTDKGAAIADLRNVLIALRSEPGYSDAFAFDEMMQACKIMSQPPIAKGAQAGPATPRILDPEDVTRTQEWLQAMGISRIGHDVVAHAVELMGRERRFHPLRDWLDKLEWDGEPRLGTWLRDYLGTPDDEYHRQIGAMFLIAMVARIFEPGCQSDYMIVLEGPQGEEKSKLCRAIAGDEYFSDHLPKIDSDQVRLSAHLRGKWLVEIAELSAFSKAEAEALKAFITRRVEIYTPKYGRVERHEPRQCLFVGTTNNDDYIKDDTGGRRYWPVTVFDIDLDGFIDAREQLFAEAVAAYREGKPYWPDRQFEKTEIAPLQEQRQFEDAWTEDVLKLVEGKASTTTWEVGQGLGFELSRFDVAIQRRIASILRKAKWKRGRSRKTGCAVWRNPAHLPF